ncbi:glycosyltransferase family 39 protein [Thalassoglobus sp. JC818]|uniref:glycosyltransferase family 39 protein n=1 Tax=Thalassoglobus sp. JC818 TaxID=3232136 RepID=UPI00345AFDDA
MTDSLLKRHATTLVFLWMVIIAAVTLGTIEQSPLWTDEVILLITARREFVDGLVQREDYSAPLYSLLVRSFVTQDGPPEWVLRFPAFVAGIVCLPAIYWLGRKFFGIRVGLLSALFLGLSPAFLRYVREARPYTLFMLFSILSMGMLFQLLRETGRGRAGYVISTWLMICSHYYGFLAFAGQGAFVLSLLVFDRGISPKLQRVLNLQCFVLVLLVPLQWLFCRFLETNAPATLGGWLQPPGAWEIITCSCLGEFFYLPSAGWVIALAIGIAIWAMFVHDKDRNTSNRSEQLATGLCLIWILFAMLIPAWGISLIWRPVYEFRYGLPAMVPIIVLTMRSVTLLNRGWQLVALMLIAAAMVPGILVEFERSEGFPEVVAWVESQPDDSTEIYVTDWSYCEEFRHPELVGLAYYGLAGDPPKLLPLKYPYAREVADSFTAPTGRIVCIAFIGHEEVLEYFEERGSDVNRHQFGSLTVLEISPALAPSEFSQP